MKIPQTMRAVEISKPGGPDVLRVVERPVPVPGYGQILIKTAYAGVNRPDVLQRACAYAPPPTASDLPGLEASGAIVAVGPGAGSGSGRWATGDQVCALLPGGGYAEYAVTNGAHALPLPANMDLKSATCLPETYFTVWSNVFMRVRLRAGEKFLVHGGTSGVGTTAIQLARSFGARVFATAGSDQKCKACLQLGAERAINYRDQDFVSIIRGEGGADVILDMVGGDYVQRNIRALADDGRLVQIAFLQGAKVELGMAELMMRRLSVTGSTLRPQSDLMKTRIAAELAEKVWPLLDAGSIAPVMDKTFALADAGRAHQRMESGQHIGKIVLKVG